MPSPGPAADNPYVCTVASISADPVHLEEGVVLKCAGVSTPVSTTVKGTTQDILNLAFSMNANVTTVFDNASQVRLAIMYQGYLH